MLKTDLLSRSLAGAAFAVLLATASAVPGQAIGAQVMVAEPALNRVIYVPRDKSLAFRLSGPATRMVVSQPEIAKVTPTGDRSFYVQGVEFGSTNLLVYGLGGRLQEVIDVRVGYDATGLQQDLAAAFPNERIQVQNLGETLLLTGDVSTTGVQQRAESMAQAYAPDAVISRMNVRLAQQVVLEVRVIEATRSVARDLGATGNIGNSSFGFTWGNGLISANAPEAVLGLFGGAGNTNIDVILLAAEEKGLARTLARPNLVAISGQKATFHAGGEYPYPVPQRDNLISLEFRKYGVELTFTPLVEDNGLIRLDVEPKVSQLDFTNALRVQGFVVPALTVRHTRTMVQLKNGEYLAIGGLLQRDYLNTLRGVPALGDVPVLGALFRSTRFRKAETELIVLVTPRLATQADIDRAATIKVLPGTEPTQRDLFLKGKVLDKPIAPEGAE
jgi:pilus assembly protein CpaC